MRLKGFRDGARSPVPWSMLPTDAPWSGLRPVEVQTLFAHVSSPWWICGGWAIDLWVGRSTRDHADLDIGCADSLVAQIVGELEGWEVFLAKAGTLSPWRPGDALDGSLWLSRRGSATWDVQLMPERTTGDNWHFRRDHSVTRTRSDLTWTTPDGMPVLKPEIQLLYKAKSVRPKDQADFEVTVPTLSEDSRAWLSATIRRLYPSHPWLSHLAYQEE